VTLPRLLDFPVDSDDLQLTSDDLPVTSGDLDIVKLAAGSRHSLAVASTGHAYSWGCNDYGQLGHGDLVSRDYPSLIGCFVRNGLQVTDVFAGSWNSVFIGYANSGHCSTGLPAKD